MKKLLGSVFAMMMAIVAFNSCSDVPEPFDIPEFAKDSTKTDTATVSPKGDGTQANPYNVAAVLKLYSDGVLPENEVYIEGTVTEIKTSDFSTQYGNLTYYINDGGSTPTYYIYRGYYYNGDKFTSADQLKVGDKVVLRGTLTLYNNTKETKQGSSIVSINGQTKGGDNPSTTGTPKGSGTQADPYNATKANQVGAALDENGKAENVYVEGIVSQVKELDTGQYGNATYYISEDGTTTSDQFYVYRGYNTNGDKFTSESQLKVGMKVVVLGTIVNFRGNTVEMTQGSKIVSADGGQSATVGLNASFASGDDGFTFNDISLSDGVTYVWKYDSSNKYMKASAYVNRKNLPAQSRLTSPVFSLEGLKTATLTFEHTGKFFKDAASELKVQVSTDGKTWTDLAVSAYPTGADWKFVTATCDLSKYAGQKTVYIGFLYTSTSEHAATWEIKNVVVK